MFDFVSMLMSWFGDFVQQPEPTPQLPKPKPTLPTP
jgi:hypothetical protein